LDGETGNCDGGWEKGDTFEESPFYDVGEGLFSRKGGRWRDGERWTKVDVEGGTWWMIPCVAKWNSAGRNQNLNFDLLKIEGTRRTAAKSRRVGGKAGEIHMTSRKIHIIPSHIY
jgi:hypothetical protein